MKWSFPAGQTPLDPQELTGLRVKGLRDQSELDFVEAVGIANAEIWLSGQSRPCPYELPWLLELHRRMFGEVWTWAGQLRQTQRNLGVPFTQIRSQLNQLVENARYQAQSGQRAQQIASYLHHGLLFVHPFPNGNGRWARRVTEAHCDVLSIMPPRWIELHSSEVSKFRVDYIAALKIADSGDLGSLEALIFDVGQN